MLKTKKQNKKKKGFTLIELIVVLAVLAIIALIAIPNFNQIRENSKIKSDERGADLIDKSVTLLVQDGSITGVAGSNGTGDTKYFVYGYNANGELYVEPGTGGTTLATGELEKVKETIIDGKGPQSYNKKAAYRIVAEKLGTTKPNVKVEVYKSVASAKAGTAADLIYHSDKENSKVATN